MHNQEVQSVDTDEVVALEKWSFVQKNTGSVVQGKLIVEIAGLG